MEQIKMNKAILLMTATGIFMVIAGGSIAVVYASIIDSLRPSTANFLLRKRIVKEEQILSLMTKLPYLYNGNLKERLEKSTPLDDRTNCLLTRHSVYRN